MQLEAVITVIAICGPISNSLMPWKNLQYKGVLWTVLSIVCVMYSVKYCVCNVQC